MTQSLINFPSSKLIDVEASNGINRAWYSWFQNPQFVSATLGTALGVPSGGTGLATAPTDGQVLIGNGSTYTLSGLTAGAGIGVTNGPGSITLTNAGVTSITGTMNQVFASNPTGDVVLYLPQDIDASANVQFGTVSAVSGTQIASSPGLYSSQRWNNAAVTFTGIQFDLSDTASSATSTVLKFTNSAVTQFSVGKTGTLTTRGDIILDKTATFIRGDFSNATIANRASIQTTTANDNSRVQILPNGSATISSISVYNNSVPTDSAFGSFNASTGEIWLASDVKGAGVQKPLSFYIATTQVGQWDTSFNFITIQGRADQSFSYQVPVAGFSITIANGVYTLILDPAGVLATGTIIMPSAPTNGQVVRFTSTQTITALTVTPNGGQSISNAPTALTVSLVGPMSYEFIYRTANAMWFRLQ